MSQFEEQILNRYISQEDMEEFGHDNINSFIADENAFNEWYSTKGVDSLDSHKLKSMIKGIEYQQNKLIAMDKVMDIDRVEKFISLYDMVDDD